MLSILLFFASLFIAYVEFLIILFIIGPVMGIDIINNSFDLFPRNPQDYYFDSPFRRPKATYLTVLEVIWYLIIFFSPLYTIILSLVIPNSQPKTILKLISSKIIVFFLLGAISFLIVFVRPYAYAEPKEFTENRQEAEKLVQEKIKENRKFDIYKPTFFPEKLDQSSKNELSTSSEAYKLTFSPDLFIDEKLRKKLENCDERGTSYYNCKDIFISDQQAVYQALQPKIKTSDKEKLRLEFNKGKTFIKIYTRSDLLTKEEIIKIAESMEISD